MSFLPQDYSPPKTSAGNYMKFQDGVNKFRALSAPVFGFEYWVDEDGKRKPVRVKTFKEVPQEKRSDKTERLKYFWAFLVWNYQDEKAQLLSITQTTIQEALETLDKDPDWGDLREYDVVVTKTGKELETSYQVNPKPKNKFEAKDKTIPTVNFDALFTGEDPFNSFSNAELDKIAKELDGSLDLTDAQA